MNFSSRGRLYPAGLSEQIILGHQQHLALVKTLPVVVVDTETIATVQWNEIKKSSAALHV